jgi:hemerythrin
MPKIIWDASFSINNVEIDNQHKKWIEIINELHDALMENKVMGNLLKNPLDAMIEYGQFHFSSEEDYMKKIEYPDLTIHQHNHAVFMRKLKKYVYEKHTGKTVLNRTIMKELMNWLENHILKEDKLYALYANEMSIGRHGVEN